MCTVIPQSMVVLFFLVVFLSFVALANDPGVGEDYSCPHILRYSAALLGTHKVLEDKCCKNIKEH